jgi:2-polyprenyl-6-methoxyphenol hydroxylase-like FAD-dependent oxidoreductase
MNDDRSNPSRDADVLIVGASPTGLTLASELPRRGVHCRIVERLAELPTTTRAHGVQPRTLEGLDRMGIVEAMLAEGSTESRIQISAHGKLLVELDLHASPRPDAPYLSTLLTRQPNLERVLRARRGALPDAGRVV